MEFGLVVYAIKRHNYAVMRHRLTVSDEQYFLLRSLSVDYSSGGFEEGHSHNWPQLLYAQKGALRVRLEDTVYIVPPRRALWLPKKTPHEFFMSSDVELRTLYMRPDEFSQRLILHAMNVSGLLHEAIVRVCEKQQLDDRIEADQYLYGVIIQEIENAEKNEYSLVLPSDARARKLAELLLSFRGNLKSALEGSGLNRRTAERIFLSQTGMSPAQWLRVARLSQSIIDLTNGESIDEVTIKTGYKSRSAFSHAFKAKFGFSPGMTALKQA